MEGRRCPETRSRSDSSRILSGYERRLEQRLKAAQAGGSEEAGAVDVAARREASLQPELQSSGATAARSPFKRG